MAKFYLGQPVVCVDGKPASTVRIEWPVEGRHYRIRGMFSVKTWVARNKWVNLTFVLVTGLHNRQITWVDGLVREAAFYEERFEPATEISSLKSILSGVDRFMGKDGPKVDKKVTKRQRKKEDA